MRASSSAALRFAEQALAVLLPFLILFTGLMMLLAGPAVLVALGRLQRRDARSNSPSPSSSPRITFPYLLFICLVSLLGGILNSLHRFWVNAAAPILLNLSPDRRVALLPRAGRLRHRARPGLGRHRFAACCSSLWLLARLPPAGVKLRLRRPRLNDDVKRLLKLIWPAAAGAGAMQINLSSRPCSPRLLPAGGSVTYIYYADRLNQLPLGLVGIGLGTVLLPTIARMISGGDEARRDATSRRRGFSSRCSSPLPATAALIVGAEPIIRGLLQYGAFTADDTARHRLGARRLLDRPARLHPDQGADPRLLRPRRT